MGNKIRLNVGAGDKEIPGFVSLDIKTGTQANSLPYACDSVDEVYCSHMLEHLHHTQVLDVVREFVRVLKPGGRLRIAVPDFPRILKLAHDGEMDMSSLSHWLHGSDDVDTDRHRAVFGWNDLDMLLRSVGIVNIDRWQAEYQDCSRLDFSLNIGGYKRVITINPKPRVTMFLSAPRFGPTDFYHGVVELCRTQGWQMKSWGGDNWCKTLCIGIEQSIAETNPDYILTLDFDSCHDVEAVLPMLRLMQEHPEIAAVWPVQAHRHLDLPLGYSLEGGQKQAYDFAKNNPWGGEFTPFGSGHFGCTFFRREVFTTLPHPWLCALPSPKTGQWDADSLDNDISFWIAMQAHGFLFGQMNSVQIGHMELCSKWIDKDGKIFWQPMQHWRKHGRPKEAVFDGEAWNKIMRKKYGIPEPVVPDELKPAAAVAVAGSGLDLTPDAHRCIEQGAVEKSLVSHKELAAANGSV